MPLLTLDHLLVLTDDLAASKAFYCGALGLEDGPRPPLPVPGHWLCLDGVPRVHLADRAGYEAEVARLGLVTAEGAVDHFAFAGDNVGRFEARLAASGIEVVRNELPNGTRQLFFDDPNGVRVEIQVPA